MRKACVVANAIQIYFRILSAAGYGHSSVRPKLLSKYPVDSRETSSPTYRTVELFLDSCAAVYMFSGLLLKRIINRRGTLGYWEAMGCSSMIPNRNRWNFCMIPSVPQMTFGNLCFQQAAVQIYFRTLPCSVVQVSCHPCSRRCPQQAIVVQGLALNCCWSIPCTGYRCSGLHLKQWQTQWHFGILGYDWLQ